MLYLSILAFLRNFTTTALLPKVVSVVCYLLLIVVLSILRRISLPGSPAWLVWLGLLFSQWQQVLERDASADGQFFYAVKSTKIYCRPTRKNVGFFPPLPRVPAL